MKKAEKYILFGAGITGMAILEYYGKDRVLAVIDNDDKKIGNTYCGIPIISFKTYLKKYSDCLIIVSIYSKNYFGCIKQMKEAGIKNYFTSPPVIYGFETPEEFSENRELNKYNRIVFYGKNPITERIENCICRSNNAKVYYINNNLSQFESDDRVISIQDLQNEDTVVLTTNEMENPIRNILRKNFGGNMVDIYQYQEKRKKRYDYLKKYRDIYKGKRCFIIGNGPSLCKEDLMLIEKNKEISFAANGIFHIYDKVTWRPTHYMLCDALAYEIMYENIEKIEDENSFVADFYYTNFKPLKKANRFYLINKIYDDDSFEFSDDAVKGLYSGRTITYVMIQMACYMGIEEIYLLGVDWTGGKGTGVGRIDFYEGNKESIENNSQFDMFYEEKIAYESALKYANAHGIKIFNATRGGELEVFERVKFDCLFDK